MSLPVRLLLLVACTSGVCVAHPSGSWCLFAAFSPMYVTLPQVLHCCKSRLLSDSVSSPRPRVLQVDLYVPRIFPFGISTFEVRSGAVRFVACVRHICTLLSRLFTSPPFEIARAAQPLLCQSRCSTSRIDSELRFKVGIIYKSTLFGMCVTSCLPTCTSRRAEDICGKTSMGQFF